MSYPERTKEEALREVKYQERLHALHCRLYKRLRALLTLISLATGSAAIATSLQAMPAGLIVAGWIVALASIIDAVGNFADKAASHRVWRRDAAALLSRSEGMSLASIDSELAALVAEVDDEIESLRAVAWNDVLKSRGLESAMRPETAPERMFRAIS